MADVKWIKITTDIFDDEKIKIIDTMPARDEILVIWFKLLALTGKVNQNGMLFMNSKLPYTPEMLAAVFNRDLNIVKLSLSTFEKFGMIEVEENQVIYISNWDKHQNIDGLDKIRMQTNERVKRSREKKKQALLSDCNATRNATLTECNAIEVDIELDKELDKDTEKKKEKKSNIFTVPTIEEIDAYIKQNNYPIEAEAFYDHYQARGWMLRGVKMKDWRASVRTWNRNSGKYDSNSSKSNVATPKTVNGVVPAASIGPRQDFGFN